MTDFYRKFEDKYRGSAEVITGRLNFYKNFIESFVEINPDAKALDIGCGRGEWLNRLKDFNVKHITGIDLNAHMLEANSAQDVVTICGDALEYLSKLEDESQDIITAFHFVEHIKFDDLTNLLQDIYRCLKPGGLMILETPNAENIIVGTNNFYLDPTHNKPLPALLLNFCVEYAGFETHNIIRLQENYKTSDEVGVLDVLAGSSQDYAVVARKISREVNDTLNSLIKKNYGIDTISLAKKYDIAMANNMKNVNDKIDKQSSNISEFNKKLHDLLTESKAASVSYESLKNEFANFNVTLLKSTNHINYLIEKLERSEIEKKAIISELENIKSSRSWKAICLYRSFIINFRLNGVSNKLTGISTRAIHSSKAKNIYAKIYKVSPKAADRLKSLALNMLTSVAIRKEKNNKRDTSSNETIVDEQERNFFSLVKKINKSSVEIDSFQYYLSNIYSSEALSHLKETYGDRTVEWFIKISAAKRDPDVKIIEILPHNEIDHEIGYALYMGLLGRVPGTRKEVEYPIKHLASVILNSAEFQNFSGQNIKKWLES